MPEGQQQHAIVIGAGVAGLGTALTLSRSGWRVTVIERDPTPLPATAAEAFYWDRRGAPQVRHPGHPTERTRARPAA